MRYKNYKMIFSKACQYALKAMIYVQSRGSGTNEPNVVTLNDIAEAIESPVAFTSKILQQLKKNKLLMSMTGVNGGYYILEKQKITLKQIVVAIDGDAIFTECVLGLKQCDARNPCPIHAAYTAQKSKMEAFLNTSELSSLSEQFRNHKFSLK